ncbi:unnamed protein product [Auanema sp. JU1783]|nr:unnamed protein product [Auanema sp. JU1783]
MKTEDSEVQELEDSAQSVIPLGRIRNLILSVNDSLPPSGDGLFAFAKACELFVDDLVKGVNAQYGNNIDYDELASYVCENEDLCYLHEFFPQSMTFDRALQKVKEKNAE